MIEVEIIIHDVAFGGTGVGRLPNGKVVFVPYTLTGEKVRVRIHRSKKDFSEAELVEILIPSSQRTSPPCIYFGRCGGCQYQHATYEEQLRIKEKQVRDALQRIGEFKELPPFHVEAAPQPYGYRNKITVHKGPAGEIGFFAEDHSTIIDVERCLIASDALNAQLASLRKASSKPHHMSLIDQTLRPEIPEGSFHQINTLMATRILDWLRQQIAPGKEMQLLEFYCGTGFFALGLADLFIKICGVDRDKRAIHTAMSRAQILGISGAQFFHATVEECMGRLLEETPPQKTILLIDPPRKGLALSVIEHLSQNPCASLIYISCNPTTLARDLKKLLHTRSTKYTLHQLGVFDMFPQTAHIETVAILQPV